MDNQHNANDEETCLCELLPATDAQAYGSLRATNTAILNHHTRSDRFIRLFIHQNNGASDPVFAVRIGEQGGCGT